METQTQTETIHPWERAGLGKAPFICTARTRETYQACPGAPIQVGGSCDYCSTGIMDTYWIKSADGQRFKVGSSCVRKCNAPHDRVVAQMDKLRLKAAKDRRHAKEAARDAVTVQALATPGIQASLRSHPHPRTWRAEAGDTLLDWCNWMMENSGATGRGKVAKRIKSI